MLRVRTFLSGSHVHGLGLFADEDIKQGDVIWSFTPGMDQVFGPRKLISTCRDMDEEAMRYLCGHIYKRNNRYYLLSDNARFINHSDTDCNIAMVDEMTEVATRDIFAGQELLENYFISYDNDDPFFFEINGICVDKFLSMTKKERRILAQGKDIS